MNRITRWVDARTGFSGPVRDFLNYPIPQYVHKNFLYTLGGLTLIAFLLQMVTGILLVFYYDPSVEGAYNSVDYITYILPLGWLVRGVHHYGSSAMVILVALHMLRTYYFSAYKKPREINWLTGVLLLFLVLAFGFTGYLLPWDQKGFWATKVGTEIAGSVPLIGPQVRALMRGGQDLGQVTLTRFYATHIMLPAAVILLIVAHIFQLRYHGMAPPLTQRAQGHAKTFVPFFPHWVITDTVAGLGVVFAVNSSIHSYLVLAYTDNDKVALNVGFYYMANAGGRLLGTVASGLLYQGSGLTGCLWGAVVCLVLAWAISFELPRHDSIPDVVGN